MSESKNVIISKESESRVVVYENSGFVLKIAKNIQEAHDFVAKFAN